MFPIELVVTMDLNIWKTRFLDVNIWYNVECGEMSTSVQHKQNAPLGHVKAMSNHPKHYKLEGMIGELLRNRRICSDRKIIAIMDDVVIKKFKFIGYDWHIVESRFGDLKRKIIARYTEHCTRLDLESQIERLNKYGGAVEFSQVYLFASTATGFISRMRLEGEPKLLLRPGTKLKN